MKRFLPFFRIKFRNKTQREFYSAQVDELRLVPLRSKFRRNSGDKFPQVLDHALLLAFGVREVSKVFIC